MRILVLGGTEFLSYAVAAAAVHQGHEVTCLARGSNRKPPTGCRFVRADRNNGTDTYAPLRGEWDEVVDVSWVPRRVQEALHVLGPRTAHWTYVSSVSVYSDHATVAQNESAPLLPAFDANRPVDRDHYGEAKVACEQVVGGMLGDRAHVVRAGLIAGTGDNSDRFGYWPARFARDRRAVLVPDTPSSTVQVIGVNDLAGWILQAAKQGVTGAINAVGDAVRLNQIIRLAREAAESRAEPVPVSPDWLVDMKVSYWAGPESLPLWLPSDYTGFCTRSNAAAKAAGLSLSPGPELMRDALEYEKRLGLGRNRRAGLSAGRETALLQLWRSR